VELAAGDVAFYTKAKLNVRDQIDIGQSLFSIFYPKVPYRVLSPQSMITMLSPLAYPTNRDNQTIHQVRYI